MATTQVNTSQVQQSVNTLQNMAAELEKHKAELGNLASDLTDQAYDAIDQLTDDIGDDGELTQETIDQINALIDAMEQALKVIEHAEQTCTNILRDLLSDLQFQAIGLSSGTNHTTTLLDGAKSKKDYMELLMSGQITAGQLCTYAADHNWSSDKFGALISEYADKTHKSDAFVTAAMNDFKTKNDTRDAIELKEGTSATKLGKGLQNGNYSLKDLRQFMFNNGYSETDFAKALATAGVSETAYNKQMEFWNDREAKTDAMTLDNTKHYSTDNLANGLRNGNYTESELVNYMITRGYSKDELKTVLDQAGVSDKKIDTYAEKYDKRMENVDNLDLSSGTKYKTEYLAMGLGTGQFSAKELMSYMVEKGYSKEDMESVFKANGKSDDFIKSAGEKFDEKVEQKRVDGITIENAENRTDLIKGCANGNYTTQDIKNTFAANGDQAGYNQFIKDYAAAEGKDATWIKEREDEWMNNIYAKYGVKDATNINRNYTSGSAARGLWTDRASFEVVEGNGDHKFSEGVISKKEYDLLMFVAIHEYGSNEAGRAACMSAMLNGWEAYCHGGKNGSNIDVTLGEYIASQCCPYDKSSSGSLRNNTSAIRNGYDYDPSTWYESNGNDFSMVTTDDYATLNAMLGGVRINQATGWTSSGCNNSCGKGDAYTYTAWGASEV